MTNYSVYVEVFGGFVDPEIGGNPLPGFEIHGPDTEYREDRYCCVPVWCDSTTPFTASFDGKKFFVVTGYLMKEPDRTLFECGNTVEIDFMDRPTLDEIVGIFTEIRRVDRDFWIERGETIPMTAEEYGRQQALGLLAALDEIRERSAEWIDGKKVA